MKNINIVSNTNFTGNKKLKLYKDIFGELPWNEGFLCDSCNSIYPKKFSGSCNCGNSQLSPFYKNSDLKSSFENLSLRSQYQELIATILDDYIGFIWGWNTSLSDLNKDKLGLNELELKKLSKNLEKYSNFNLESFYYFAEIGVKSAFRGNDIAGKLYRENLQKLQDRREKYILVRTTRKSDLPYKWFKEMGYEDVYLYNDEQDRVILVCKI